jgi:hypothetical protein
MFSKTAFCLTLIFSSFCYGQCCGQQLDEHDEKVATKYARKLESHQKNLDNLKKDLQAMESGRINRAVKGNVFVAEKNGVKRYQFSSPAAKQAQIKLMEKWIADPDFFDVVDIKNLTAGTVVKIRLW